MALSAQRMLDLFQTHAELEFQNDFEGALGTVAPNPSYEYHPHGLRIDGREAVEALYRRICANFNPILRERENRLTAYGERELVSEDLIEVEHPSTGRREQFSVVSIFLFDDDGLVLGERVYMPGMMAELITDALGRDFLKVPGVTKIN